MKERKNKRKSNEGRKKEERKKERTTENKTIYKKYKYLFEKIKKKSKSRYYQGKLKLLEGYIKRYGK